MTDEKQNDMPDVIWVYREDPQMDGVLRLRAQVKKGSITHTPYHRTLSDEEFEGLKKAQPVVDGVHKQHLYKSGYNACLDMLREKGIL